MRIAIFSDLHLSHWNRLDLGKDLSQLVRECSPADVVFNAGDTHEARFNLANPGWMKAEWFKDKPYYEIKGNHDYYGGTFKNEFYTFELGDHHKVFAGTLWTNFNNNPLTAMVAERSINDFRLITDDAGDLIIGNTLVDAYNETVAAIDEYKPTIIMTHFPPLRACSHPRFGDNSLTGYFVNNMRELIGRHKQIKLWISGHTHGDYDFEYAGIRFVSNQLGYPAENQNDFEDYHPKLVDIE